MHLDNFRFLCEWIYERTGNVLRTSTDTPFVARFERLATGLAMSTDDLVDSVRNGRHPRIDVQVMEVILNSETLFFRNVRLFHGIRYTIIPALLKARRQQRTLRIWSGACSTGQEIYSALILLREHFPELRQWRLDVVASDLSPTRVHRAQRGRYSQGEVNRGLPARYLVRYFTKQSDDWLISRDLIESVQFRVQNLLEPWRQAGKFDIILLRNVLIYFDPVGRERVLRRAHARLHDDAYLILGGAETPRPVSRLFDRIAMLPGCYHPADRPICT